MELCTFCDMRAEVFPLFADEEYLEEIEPFEDRFRITKAEMEEFYGTYREMSEQGKGRLLHYTKNNKGKISKLS